MISGTVAQCTQNMLIFISSDASRKPNVLYSSIVLLCNTVYTLLTSLTAASLKASLKAEEEKH